MNIMIEIINVVKEFDDGKQKIEAVKKVNLKINKGEIFGIIGLSGAGKSTLLRCINRLEEPTEGKILIDNIDITRTNNEDLRKERKEIGMIFQHFNLLLQKTVYENIAFPLRLENMDKNEIDKRVNQLLEYVELRDKKDSYPSQLSGGQKQRVAIARAIANNPKILLSDEVINPNDFKGTIIRLSFLEKSAKQPIVAKMIRNFHIDVNILSGNINKLHLSSVGHLILELSGESSEINKAILFLKDEDIHVEVI